MKYFFRNNKGETLAETIIALSILAVGITSSSAIMVNSTRNLTNAKNRVVAVNIAREGIEAMRNIRDTNWLFYSDRRRQCWNHDPSVGTCDPADPSHIIEPGHYVIYKRNDESWRLVPADSNWSTDTDGDTNPYNDLNPNLMRLSLTDIDASLDSDGDGDSTNDFDMYNHLNGTTDPLGTEARGTTFTRSIFIEYLANDGTDYSYPDAVWDPIDKDVLNRMRVTSTVEWTHGSTHTAELTTIITDHLGRESLTN
jgi:type II secretory pathway pseudopilin PulG